MKKPDAQVNFRMPFDLREMLKAAADASGRTLTAEIVLRLERSFEEASQSEIDALAKVIDDRFSMLERQMEILESITKSKNRPTGKT